MPNVTLSIDEDTIKKVRKIAVERDTTLTAMVREFLRSVADRDATDRQRAVGRLRKSFSQLSRDMGERSWTREQLYER